MKTQIIFAIAGIVLLLNVIKYIAFFKKTGLDVYYYISASGVIGGPIFILSAIFYGRIGQNVNLIPIFIAVLSLLLVGGAVAVLSPSSSVIVWNDSIIALKSFKLWLKSMFGILPSDMTKVKDIRFNKLLFAFGSVCFYYAFLFVLFTREKDLDIPLLLIECTGWVAIVFSIRVKETKFVIFHSAK